MQMIEQTAAVALLQQSLRDISTGWSLGTFGALAEFHHVASDLPPLITLTSNGGEVITGRGAMRAAFCEEVLPLAYEGLTQDPRGWNQTLSFCLRTELARMAGRAVLMELGPDKGAIREADREAILFDLGVDAAHVDFCVRTDDPELVAALRQAAGQSVLEPGHPALAAIAAASPHRVATSRLGRIEVYQPIPTGPEGRSPIGPHTHLLLQLLRNGRTHSANAPIPRGWTPALNLHPPSPITDSLGHRRPFAADAHAAFQALLRAYAPPGAVAEKHRITRSVLAGERPQHYLVAPTRAERKAARVALRQMLHTHPDNPVLPSWLETFDRGADAPDADA
jgi:hypothetical protein